MEELSGEKRKRNADVDPDEVVDLEALVKDYEAKYGDRETGSRLAIDEAEKPKRKPKAADEPEAGISIELRRAAEEMKQAGRDMGRELSKAGKEFGRVAGEWGEKFGKDFGKKGEKWGKDFGKQIEEFFQHPYEPGYHSIQYANVSDEERNVAAIAHGSSVLTLFVGIFSAGILVPVLVFVPLFLYMRYRNRSEFVAQHAMQAFVMQLVGTFGWLAVVLGSGILGIILTVLLAITIVGILAIPFLWLAIILFWAVSLVMPLGGVAFGVVGALNALQGRSFKYPYVGRWVDRRAHAQA